MLPARSPRRAARGRGQWRRRCWAAAGRRGRGGGVAGRCSSQRAGTDFPVSARHARTTFWRWRCQETLFSVLTSQLTSPSCTEISKSPVSTSLAAWIPCSKRAPGTASCSQISRPLSASKQHKYLPQPATSRRFAGGNSNAVTGASGVRISRNSLPESVSQTRIVERTTLTPVEIVTRSVWARISSFR
jgi:hypothetical protein